MSSDPVHKICPVVHRARFLLLSLRWSKAVYHAPRSIENGVAGGRLRHFLPRVSRSGRALLLCAGGLPALGLSCRPCFTILLMSRSHRSPKCCSAGSCDWSRPPASGLR
ncbi:hypothetical protein SS05631_c09440 [Sinorhizobium sp. CCBAU 05631]|nr:hypothetical protein SS05631_c09440 [Sinorhizobium sp. CCBAU 05631]